MSDADVIVVGGGPAGASTAFALARAGASVIHAGKIGQDGSLLIDEINTLPGFTPASMFPRLWQAAGVSYGQLIARLVDLALARHRGKPIA